MRRAARSSGSEASAAAPVLDAAAPVEQRARAAAEELGARGDGLTLAGANAGARRWPRPRRRWRSALSTRRWSSRTTRCSSPRRWSSSATRGGFTGDGPPPAPYDRATPPASSPARRPPPSLLERRADAGARALALVDAWTARRRRATRSPTARRLARLLARCPTGTVGVVDGAARALPRAATPTSDGAGRARGSGLQRDADLCDSRRRWDSWVPPRRSCRRSRSPPACARDGWRPVAALDAPRAGPLRPLRAAELSRADAPVGAGAVDGRARSDRARAGGAAMTPRPRPGRWSPAHRAASARAIARELGARGFAVAINFRRDAARRGRGRGGAGGPGAARAAGPRRRQRRASRRGDVGHAGSRARARRAGPSRRWCATPASRATRCWAPASRATSTTSWRSTWAASSTAAAHAARRMIARRRGAIVTLSSVAAQRPGRGQSNYAASKGAVEALTPRAGRRAGPARDPRQRGRARRHRHGDERRRPRAGARRAARRASCCAGRARPTRSRRWSRFCAATTPATSPARSGTSTEVSSWNERTRRRHARLLPLAPQRARRSRTRPSIARVLERLIARRRRPRRPAPTASPGASRW